MDKFRVLVCDGEPMRLNGVLACVRDHLPEAEVVGVVRQGRELLRKASKLKPDLILSEVALYGVSLHDAARKLIASRTSRVACCVGRDERALIPIMEDIGVCCLTRDDRPKNSVRLLRAYMAAPWPRQGRHRSTMMLTPRQVEIQRLMLKGMRSKDIADSLGLSVRTVEGHRLRLTKMKKIQGRKP